MGTRKATFGGQLADLDLRLLRVFKAVVENGGISAAENELNLAISTISNYLSDLEQRLEMRLCVRGRRGFSLTDEGERVYAGTLELLASIEQFQQRIRSDDDRLVGTLRLGIAEYASLYHNGLITQLLTRFTEAAPEVYLDLQVLLAEEVCRAVADERIMIGISSMPRAADGFDLKPLFDEPMLLYCGARHPLYSVDEQQLDAAIIGNQRFIQTPMLKPGRIMWPAAEQWRIQARASQIEARLLLLQTGNFIGYLPEPYIEAMGLTGELRPLLPEQFNYTNQYYLITRQGGQLTPILQCLLDCLA